jgi:hypothetical protein
MFRALQEVGRARRPLRAVGLAAPVRPHLAPFASDSRGRRAPACSDPTLAASALLADLINIADDLDLPAPLTFAHY